MAGSWRGAEIFPLSCPHGREDGLMTAMSVMSSLELISTWELPPEMGLVADFVRNPSKWPRDQLIWLKHGVNNAKVTGSVPDGSFSYEFDLMILVGLFISEYSVILNLPGKIWGEKPQNKKPHQNQPTQQQQPEAGNIGTTGLGLSWAWDRTTLWGVGGISHRTVQRALAFC